MKIFFLCRTGHHTALLAAGLHLGIIGDGMNLRRDVAGLQGWDDIRLKDVGIPFYVGRDKDNNDIYTIGIAKKASMMEKMINDIIYLIGIESHERRIINVSQAVTGWTKMGLVIKKMHLNSLAKKLFFIGIKSEINRVNQVLRKSDLKTC